LSLGLKLSGRDRTRQVVNRHALGVVEWKIGDRALARTRGAGGERASMLSLTSINWPEEEEEEREAGVGIGEKSDGQ
jgi:hypothetical protein